MAKDVKREAAKAVTKLGRQSDRRRAVGGLRDAVKEQTKHSTRRLAYDLNGDPH
jgi:hypothetical protein